MQNDERANYQLDVKFQESYLQKVVILLQCNLSEGAILESETGGTDKNNIALHENGSDELEEGELTNSSSESFLFVISHYALLITSWDYYRQLTYIFLVAPI